MTEVFCLGVAVLDFVFNCDDIPDLATKYRARSAETVTGGGAANAAIAIAKLGGTVSLAARLGDDPLADLITRGLADDGVNTDQLHKSKGGQSSYSSIVVDRQGERQIVNFRGENLTSATDWITLPANANAVLADTRWAGGMTKSLKLARAEGIPGVVDIDTPLDDCDFTDATHLAFARRALSELTGTGDIETGLRNVTKTYGAWACATDGADGCYLLENDALRHINAPNIEAVDTLGAGDVWHGAFTLALAEGRNEIIACKFANIAAGLKCTQKGVAKGTPDRSTVLQLMGEIDL